MLYSVEADDSNGWESVTRGVSVADLDGDGGPDLAFLNGKGLFRVVRGRDGRQLYEFDAATVCEKPLNSGSHGVTIADLNGDGRLEVFFVVGGGEQDNWHGMAVCLTGFAGRGPGWYTFRHDHRNSGNIETPLEPALAARLAGTGLRPSGTSSGPALER